MRVKVDALRAYIGTKVQPSSERVKDMKIIARFELSEITPVGTILSKVDYPLLFVVSIQTVAQTGRL